MTISDQHAGRFLVLPSILKILLELKSHLRKIDEVTYMQPETTEILNIYLQ